MSPVKWSERRVWREARSLADLGVLMARWIEGDLRSRPGYYGPTDLDTTEVTRVCAALCRAGMVTTGSQAGGGPWPLPIRGEVVRARAAVEMFVAPDGVAEVERAAARAGLLFVSHRIPSRSWFAGGGQGAIPVTASDTRVYTAFGGRIVPSDLGVMWEGIGDAAWREVLTSYQVAVVDPEWCRDTVLWGALGELVGVR